MLCYCDKCGNICEAFKDELEDGCFCCGNSPLKPIPRVYIDNSRWRNGDGKEAFIEEIVKKSPNLDKTLFEHRDEIIQRKNDEMKASIAVGKAILEEKSRVPKCPTCGSLNVEKISTGKKIFGGAMFGLFSSDVRNTMHCKNCGAKW